MNRARSRSVDQSADKPPVVMVVEDEFLLQLMIADELRSAGFQVIECGDADEAVDLLHSGIMVSLIFSDIRMPGSMDGVVLARAVHEQFPALKVILTSSELPPAMSGYIGQFVPKPYDPRSVIRVIDGLLTGTSEDARG
jgi:CheY-like chemotaxis protein